MEISFINLYNRNGIIFSILQNQKGKNIMKLGAQLFSLRNFIKTPEDIRTTFEKIKAMGFENVQFSGGGPIDALELKAISEETGLPIVCTHSSFDRILGDTDALIEEHKIFGCPVIGLGSMPKEYRNGEKDMMSFFEDSGQRSAFCLPQSRL